MRRKNSTMERLIGPFEILARTYSKKWNVRIVPSGTRLATNGEIIYFPWNASDIKKVPFDVLNGHLDHEVGHIRDERRNQEYGRKSCLEIMGELKKNKKPTLMWLMNIFEDIRMEIQYSKEYIGIAENLRAANVHSMKELATRKDENFWNSFGCCILAEAFGFNSSDFFDDKYFPYVELCREEIDDSKEISWSEESIELARRVYMKVSDYAEDLLDKEKEGEDSGDDPDPDDKSPGEDSYEDPSDGDGSKPKKTTPKAGDGRDSKADRRFETAEEALKEPTLTDYMDVGKEKIAEESKKLIEELDQYVPNPDTLRRDTWVVPPMGDDAVFMGLRTIVAAQTKALRTKLARRLKVLTQARESYDQESGRLDETSLSQLRVGERRVFGVTTPGIKISTAVLILIDQSGSMGSSEADGDRKSKAYYARLAAIALSEALSYLNIPNEVIGFDNDWNEKIPRSAHFVNRTPFRYDLYKAFHESYRRVGSRMVHITGKCDNADGEAVYACALRLAERPEKRKLLFVFSDGAPCCRGLGAEGDEYLSKMIKKITSAGIEVFGAGLKTDSVSQYYCEENGASWVRIDDVENLAVSLFKVMGKKLMAGLETEAKHA